MSADVTPLMDADEYHAGVDPILEAAAAAYRPHYRFWTDADMATLRRYYGRVPPDLLARQLGRSLNSVRQQAGHIGLVHGHGE